MYQVEAATWPALLAKNPKITPVFKWNVGVGASDVLDLSDRVLDSAPVNVTLAPFLGGFRSGPSSVTLDNSDAMLSPLSAESPLNNTPDENIFQTKTETYARVHRPGGGYEDIPVGAGLLRYVRLAGNVAELRSDDYMTAVMSTPAPAEVLVSHATEDGHTASNFCKVLLDDYTIVDSTDDIDQTSFDLVDDLLVSIGWEATGRVPTGVTIGDAIAGLGRSGMFQVAPNASGKLRFLSEFPQTFTTFPHEFNASNSWDFEYVTGMEHYVSEVVVRYRGVSASYRDDTYEADLGRVPVVVDAPFLAFYNQARWEARFLYEMHGAFQPVVKFRAGSMALPLELGDRAIVRDPGNDVRRTVRVVSKTWDGVGVDIEGVAMGHESSIISATIAKYGDSWGAGTLL